MMALWRRIQDFITQLNIQHETIWLAYSGGLDSHVLLQLFARAKASNDSLRIAAIHVNHQLQDDASDWEHHCQKQCNALTIPLTICRVDASTKERQSPEEAAREARYNAFSAQLKTGDILVTAHHANDQAETVLLQLMRGAGAAGLSAMPERRLFKGMQLHRPLLGFSRQVLYDYAVKHDLDWIEDPSNAEIDIRRNYVRHKIMPLLSEQWSHPERLIAQSSRNLADTQQSLDWFLDRALADLLLASDVLAINALDSYSSNIQKHLIRRWYRRLGIPAPGADKLCIIFNEVIDAKEDANPELSGHGAVLHRSKGRLILSPEWPTLEVNTWVSSTALSCPAWNLTIKLVDEIDIGEISVRLADPNTEIQLNNHPRRLKRLYKEKSVPVKFRSLLPAVYVADELIYIPGIFQHQDFRTIEFCFDFKRLGADFDVTHPSAPSQPLLSVLGIE